MAEREFEDVDAIAVKSNVEAAHSVDMIQSAASSEQQDPSSRKYCVSESVTSKRDPVESSVADLKERKKAVTNDSAIKFQGVGELSPDAGAQAVLDNDEEEDDNGGQFQLVKKSIYKSPKKGSILNRLTGMATTSSKAKYALSNLTTDSDDLPKNGSTSPNKRFTEQHQLDEINLNEVEGIGDTEIDFDEEDAIDVSITQPDEQEPTDPPLIQTLSSNGEDRRAYRDASREKNIRKEEHEAPQVIIHSGESDSETGFATLNPIIAAKRKLNPSTTSSRLATIASTDASPFLNEIPIREKNLGELAESSSARFLLIINALGASGLPKVEKFGTQSTLIEMKLTSKEGSDGNKQQRIMRSGLHKKGGSEAQWNQQFSVGLESKQGQYLQVTVKTNNRMIVGQALVSLDKVGDLFYDQHYPLFRSEDASREEVYTSGIHEPAGMVHLQLKIVDATSIQAVPPLHLPFPTASDPAPPAALMPNSLPNTQRIPPQLANGGLFFKVPFHNNSMVGYSAIPRRQWVTVAEDNHELAITWCDPTAPSVSAGKKSSAERRLPLSMIVDIREGHSTKAFEFHKANNVVKEVSKCFSLIAKQRTLDLVAASKEEATMWVSSLREIVYPSTNRSTETASFESARTIEDYRQAALSSRQQSSKENPTKKKQQLAIWKTKLFELARQNQLDAIATCLQDGCPVDLLEAGTGDTLLIAACRQGNAPLVELCLSWRAKNDPHPEFGDTALQVAVAHQRAECLKLLLLTAAKSEMDSEIVNHIDSCSDAPLHVAARNGDFACLQLLLLHGADICVVDEIGRTPLHCAVSVAHQGGTDCVAYLLDVGGDSVLNLGDAEGDTPLHYAALAGNEHAVKVLLESAADALALNSNGETPLDIARREQHKCCIDLIAPYCVAPNPDDESTEQRIDQRILDEIGNEEETQAHHRLRVRRDRRHDHHKHEYVREAVDNEDDSDVECSDDHESMYDSSGYSSSQLESPPRSSVVEFREHQWDVRDMGHNGTQFRSQTARLASSQPPMPTLSPSEQVRAALSHQQRSFSVSTTSRLPMSARSTFENASHRNLIQTPGHYPVTARDWTTSSTEQRPLYWMNGHQVLPMRANRSHMYHDPYQNGNESAIPLEQSDARYSRLRSQSESGYRSKWDYGDVNHAWMKENTQGMNPDFHFRSAYPVVNISTYTNTALMPTRQELWARRPATADPPAMAAKWDLVYTQDGYPYYVNRQTGISQWEKPLDFESPVPPLPPHNPIQSVTISRSPDEIIRMRLAQARRQQSVPSPFRRHQSMVEVGNGRYEHSSDSGSKSLYGPIQFAPSIETDPALHLATAEAQSPEPTTVADTSVITQGNTLNENAPVAPMENPSVLVASSSTYEARTGLRLSIDISSPPSKEHARPEFVPSPRAKSNASPRLSEQTTADGTSEGERPTEVSFQKSRPSSPRGRSKNVSLIDIKRANNLAIALASFKIHDRYEQIIDGILTMDEEMVSAPLLACMQRFFPTEQEREALQRFRGNVSTLGKPERFFYLLFQVPAVQTRIEMFLYKLEFGRMKQTLLGRVLVVKRACRDVAENYAFVRAVELFYNKQASRSLAILEQNRDMFKRNFLNEADEKFLSFRKDLEKAAAIDLTDMQLQLNRLLAGRRSIEVFVNQKQKVSVSEADISTKDPSESARETLERFLMDTRKPMTDVEREFEGMEQWVDKLLDVFGESKASCRLADIIEFILSFL